MTAPPMQLNSDLYLLGIGQYGVQQITIETAEILRAANEVCHFTSRQQELLAFNPKVTDCCNLYSETATEGTIFRHIARTLVDRARTAAPLAVVFDGNPMLFCTVSWEIAAYGRASGVRVEALPGISCLDVLPIELGFEPGDLGMQVLEATTFVRHRLTLNPHLATLLLQVGHFNTAPHLPPPQRAPGTFLPLTQHLLRFFPPDHPAVFIQSANGPATETCTLLAEIATLDDVREDIRSSMTLYIPRLALPDSLLYPDSQLNDDSPLKDASDTPAFGDAA